MGLRALLKTAEEAPTTALGQRLIWKLLEHDLVPVPFNPENQLRLYVRSEESGVKSFRTVVECRQAFVSASRIKDSS